MMDDEQSGSTDTFSDNGAGIPEYVDYVSLVYRFASTIFTIAMSSLVITTILKTRSLHNVHNILIINLMVSDILGVVFYAFGNTGMMVSYIIGIQCPFRCDVFHFLSFPVIMLMYTVVMLSVEKFIAIKYALRYKAIVTYRRVSQAIAGGWITLLFFKFMGLIYEVIVDAEAEYDRSSRFGLCFAKRTSLKLFVLHFFGTIVPIFLSFFITITLNVYLSIKAYQVYKRIQKETKEGRQVSKDGLNKTNILQQLKPLITLLVTILGSTVIAVIGSIMYMYVSTLTVEGPSVVKYVIFSNLPYPDMSLHTLVYGLYFKKIRQPLCRKLKRMVRSCKMNSGQVVNGRSVRRAWM